MEFGSCHSVETISLMLLVAALLTATTQPDVTTA